MIREKERNKNKIGKIESELNNKMNRLLCNQKLSHFLYRVTFTSYNWVVHVIHVIFTNFIFCIYNQHHRYILWRNIPILDFIRCFFL